MNHDPKIFPDRDPPQRCSPRQCNAVPGLRPRAPTVPAGSRSCARRTSNPIVLEEPAAWLAESGVDDTGNAEPSDPTIRFWDFHPLNRPWLIVPVEQSKPNFWPVLTQECLGGADGHPITTRASLVFLDAFPRSLKVLAAAYLLHQMFWESRAFGRRHRHRRFGSSGRGNR